jgi:hypothetical protein
MFGMIASENFGYVNVSIEQAIARGDDGCRVLVYFKQTPQARAAAGREYFQSDI